MNQRKSKRAWRLLLATTTPWQQDRRMGSGARHDTDSTLTESCFGENFQLTDYGQRISAACGANLAGRLYH